MKLGVFLLLGGIVNVAVTWGLAIRMPASVEAVNYTRIKKAGDGAFQTKVHITRGQISIEQLFEPSLPLERGRGDRRLDEGAFASIVPSWSAFSNCEPLEEYRRSGNWLDAPSRFVECATGWPFYSLKWEQMRGYRRTAIKTSVESTELPLPLKLREFLVTHRMRSQVPIHPLFWGFATNSALYGITLWLLVAIPGAVRRRMRVDRGRCVACGYNLRGHGTDQKLCPECGTSASKPS